MQPGAWEKNWTCVRPARELVAPAASKLQGLLLQVVSQPLSSLTWKFDCVLKLKDGNMSANSSCSGSCNFSSQCGQQWSQRLRDLGGNREGFVPSNGRRGKLWYWQYYLFLVQGNTAEFQEARCHRLTSQQRLIIPARVHVFTNLMNKTVWSLPSWNKPVQIVMCLNRHAPVLKQPNFSQNSKLCYHVQYGDDRSEQCFHRCQVLAQLGRRCTKAVWYSTALALTAIQVSCLRMMSSTDRFAANWLVLPTV